MTRVTSDDKGPLDSQVELDIFVIDSQMDLDIFVIPWAVT